MSSARTSETFDDVRATHVARAPGRVNLIGEHTDYNDLPVFPMALQRETRVAFRARDDARVRLVHRDARFGVREFEIGAEIAPGPQGDWGNYIKAAAQVLARERGARRGFDAQVEGDVPIAAGLSSSSALVVACGLALAHVNGIEVEPLAFADLMARGERYVGTNSGGMDQAICLAGRRGHALRIDFHPLRVEAVAVPSDWRFVVAHSLVQADKSGSAREAYNTRRAECEAALHLVLASAELRGEPASYPQLLARHGAEKLAWIAARALDGNLLRRFRHEVSEAVRVESARKAMLAGDGESFGAAMDESHASLACDFDVSHPELDALVLAARGSGALGARLTGAGFGGCAVLLARARDVDDMCLGLRRGFYARRSVPPAIGDPLLVAEPSEGARVVALGSP
jgi:galactokinase